VQDSFVARYAGWRRLRDSDKALPYLRQSAASLSRCVPKHHVIVNSDAPKPAPIVDSIAPKSVPNVPAAGQGADALPERAT